MRSPKLIRAIDAAVMVVDIQEKLAAAMDQDRLRVIVGNAVRMIRSARELSIPIIVTEQYPRGLGRTLKEVSDAIGECQVIEKLAFSAMGVEETLRRLKDARVRDVLIAGMETHVCVAQTAYDLEGLGFRAVVLADAVISRFQEDYEVALARLRGDGVTVTTTEAAIFELLEEAGTEVLGKVRKFVRSGSEAARDASGEDQACG